LGFRWDVFNVTNTPRFDVGQMQSLPDPQISGNTMARWPRATRGPVAACGLR
jgi:hypothetical protein